MFFHLGPLLAHIPRLRFLGRAPGEEWWYWLYVANWCPEDRRAGVLTHIWSLCIEEQFYLFWPVVVRFMAPARLRSVCVAILIASPLARAAGVAMHLRPELIYECTVFRLDALAAGALIAIAARDADTKRSLARFLAPGVCVSLAVLAAILWTRSASILRWPALRNLGKYSYAIYVWHPLIVARARAIFLALQPGATPFEKWLLFAAVVVAGSLASYAFGWISWRLIERPAAYWRDRLDRSPRLTREAATTG